MNAGGGGIHGLCALCALVALGTASAGEVTLELPVPYALIQDALVDQVFVGPGQTAQVLEGKNACNVLTLSDPRIEGSGGNRLRLQTTITARSGTPLPRGRCLPLFEWSGRLEVHQSPIALPDRLAVGFRVTDSRILDPAGDRRAVPGVLWDWVKQNVHPRLEGFALDLTPYRTGAATALAAAVSPEASAALESLAMREVSAGVTVLAVAFAFEIPGPPPAWTPPKAVAPLDIEALERWREGWQAWDGFATWLVKEAAGRRSAATRRALAAVLLDARHDLVAALTVDTVEDPVPALFMRTWSQLMPLLAEASRDVPAARAARYLTLISAGDALRAVNQAAPQFGLRLDRDSLRQLALLLVPELSATALDYADTLDPDLRELFGFARDFPLAIARPAWPWRWLIADAWAGPVIDPARVQRLRGWVPARDELDTYLGEVAALFDEVAAREVGAGSIPDAFVPTYQTLLRATAWQETCWRQYIAKNGRIETIRSPSGSVGIMQVNTHVWRGIYDLNGLLNDVGYNARAGNEILVHYLVDYAIRRKEHRQPGGIDNLARASYAVYNGGPGHLARYRQPSTKESLRRIDTAFLKKYRAIRQQGADAVKQCFGS